MKIVYIDQMGCYTALVAALGRCGVFKGAGGIGEFSACPDFANHRNLQPGNIYYAGKDRLGHEVYALGAGKETALMAQAAQDLFSVLGLTGEIQVFDVSGYSPFLLKWVWILNLLPGCRRLTVLIAALLLKSKVPALLKYIRTVSLSEGNEGCKP